MDWDGVPPPPPGSNASMQHTSHSIMFSAHLQTVRNSIICRRHSRYTSNSVDCSGNDWEVRSTISGENEIARQWGAESVGSWLSSGNSGRGLWIALCVCADWEAALSTGGTRPEKLYYDVEKTFIPRYSGLWFVKRQALTQEIINCTRNNVK